MITQQSAFYLPSLFVGFVREGLQEFLVWFSNNGEYEQNKWLGSDVLEISRENVTQQADSDIVQYLPTDFTFNTEVEIPAPWSLNTWMFFFFNQRYTARSSQNYNYTVHIYGWIFKA